MTWTVSNTKLQFRSGYRAREAYTAAATLACLVGRLLLAGLALVVVLVVPEQAGAAIPLVPCKTNGVRCGTVEVPLDQSGGVPGTVALHVEVLPAAGLPQGVVFLIAGGPGQGSAGAFNLSSRFTVELMRFMFPGFTLVAFDNRGTGESGVIRCEGLQASLTAPVEQEAALARDCAEIIGPARVFYATRNHAEDIDAVRQALGYDRITLFGVSYGTKLSLAYALAHPASVDRLVLDSVVVPGYPDPFERNVLQQMPGTLRGFCAGGACNGATPDFSGEVVRLAERLEARPIQGKVIAATGKQKTLSMNGEDLISLIIDADLSPGLAAELPAAAHSAVRGEVRPLLRLYDIDLQSNLFRPEDLSIGLYAATNCADTGLPWTADTPPAARKAILDSTVAALPPGALGPFGKWAARSGRAFFCEQWPSPAGNTPLAPGPFPNIPVLALNGGFDLRTPTANALAVVARFPQGRLIEVPGVGHDVTGADMSGCSQNAVRAWILGRLTPRLASCPRVQPVVKVVHTFPRRPAKPSVRSTLSVAALTLREAEAAWWQLAPGASTLRGLFGGKLVALKSGTAFTLKSYALAPGVFLTGNVKFVDIGPPSTYKGTVKVSGPAAIPGTLRFSKGSLSGTFGGRPVKARY
jgi:pimeloyl-ACP methyl ester carboxylesterase